MSPEALDVLDSLMQLGPSTVRAIALDTGRDRRAVRALLCRMNATGRLVWRVGYRRARRGRETIWDARASGRLPCVRCFPPLRGER